MTFFTDSGRATENNVEHDKNNIHLSQNYLPLSQNYLPLSQDYLPLRNVTRGHSVDGNLSETTTELNARYAAALLPLTTLLGFFIVLGLVGNLLTVKVFLTRREFEKNNFKVFVITLAVIDTFTCVTLLPVEIITHRTYFIFENVVLCKMKCFLTVFGGCSSCLALLLISVDRFQQVVKPLGKQLRPGAAVKVLFTVALIIPVLFAIPGALMCGINKTNMTNIKEGVTIVYLCETEDSYRYSVWRIVYKYMLLFVQLGISIVYIGLYTLVMKEASLHISALKEMKRNNFALTNGLRSTVILSIGGNTQQNSDGSRDTTGQPVQTTVKKHDRTPLKRVRKVGQSLRQASNRSLSSVYRNGFPTKSMVWFVLTLIFVVTYMTHLGLTLQVTDIVNMTTTRFALFVTFFRIYFINHVINPVIYAMFIRKFREAIMDIGRSFNWKNIIV